MNVCRQHTPINSRSYSRTIKSFPVENYCSPRNQNNRDSAQHAQDFTRPSGPSDLSSAQLYSLQPVQQKRTPSQFSSFAQDFVKTRPLNLLALDPRIPLPPVQVGGTSSPFLTPNRLTRSLRAASVPLSYRTSCRFAQWLINLWALTYWIDCAAGPWLG